jgi:hypothetical protein
MTIWYMLCSFGTFFPTLVSCAKTNLATLLLMMLPLPFPGKRVMPNEHIVYLLDELSDIAARPTDVAVSR